MDSNYAYMAAAQQEEGFSGFNLDKETATAAGLAALGLATAWIGNSRAKKEQQAAELAAQQQAMYAAQNSKKSNAALYVVGGLAVVGIGLAIFFAVRKK